MCCAEVDGEGHVWGVEGEVKGHLNGVESDGLE